MVGRRAHAMAALLVGVVLGCGSDGDNAAVTPDGGRAGVGAVTAAPAPPATVVTTAAPFKAPSADDRAAWARCKQAIARAKQEPALPGAADFDQARVQLARVRGRSMLWRRVPKPSHALEKLMRRNRSAINMVRAVRHMIRDTHSSGGRRRKLLREGYLWADDVRLAVALQQQVGLTDLFAKETIYLQRGTLLLTLTRKPADKQHKLHYAYADGPDKGMRAEVLLGDRVASVREELSERLPLAIDLRDLANRATFDRIRPIHLTESLLVAELRYGPNTVTTALLEHDGAALTIRCEAHDEESFRGKQRYERASQPWRQALPRLRQVVRFMVRDGMPFDADPNQSNGFLRKAWKRAYHKGWKSFQFEDKSWPVYTQTGSARPPQVCIDFITDTWERASGTWYASREEDGGPTRHLGTIDFDKLGVENRRSVAKFTQFAIEHSELFEVWEIPKAERIAFKRHKRFFKYLADHSDHFRPGDILTIHGFKHGGRPHYHSVIILEQDPVTGQPSLVAGNAVFPREQTLAGVMHISPSRTLRHRIRVKDAWLTAIAQISVEE